MLDKKYDSKLVEEGKYQFWLENNLFSSGKDKTKPAYCIVIPPIVNKPISVVGDVHADPKFGTGVVKRTPFGTKLKNMLKVKGSLGYSY